MTNISRHRYHVTRDSVSDGHSWLIRDRENGDLVIEQHAKRDGARRRLKDLKARAVGVNYIAPASGGAAGKQSA